MDWSECVRRGTLPLTVPNKETPLYEIIAGDPYPLELPEGATRQERCAFRSDAAFVVHLMESGEWRVTVAEPEKLTDAHRGEIELHLARLKLLWPSEK